MLVFTCAYHLHLNYYEYHSHDCLIIMMSIMLCRRVHIKKGRMIKNGNYLNSALLCVDWNETQPINLRFPGILWGLQSPSFLIKSQDEISRDFVRFTIPEFPK